MIRKEDGTIRPWNFEQKVDIDKTAAEFITRMTNQCTYLNNETVLLNIHYSIQNIRF